MDELLKRTNSNKFQASSAMAAKLLPLKERKECRLICTSDHSVTHAALSIYSLLLSLATPFWQGGFCQAKALVPV